MRLTANPSQTRLADETRYDVPTVVGSLNRGCSYLGTGIQFSMGMTEGNASVDVLACPASASMSLLRLQALSRRHSRVRYISSGGPLYAASRRYEDLQLQSV